MIVALLFLLISFICLIMLIVSIFKKKVKSSRKKYTLGFFICFILFLVVAVKTTKDEPTQKHSTNISKTSKKEKKKRAENVTEGLDNKTIAKIEKDIQDKITSYTYIALGKKDTEGNNLKDGKINEEYIWSTFITSLEYSKKGLLVNVNDEFLELDNDMKDAIINKVQGITQSIKNRYIELTDEEIKNKEFVEIRNNNEVKGHSKLDKFLYTWNK
ncbi:hypothetical protein OL233_08065 [Vagococcus sp. PNs007]|uniref:Uncharacterized protein n=1 Tax=Vagococcus proximus TaxID=2991417 RepID=A0ABT5X2Z5_9ENTE|nr:hypothetical protein [Vagococcus proximus]MDF0480236.1 hypothetical protein [Vagococcus proximus]